MPEVETIRRGLEPLVIGRRVVAVDSHPSAKFTPAVDVMGATFTALTRRGKYLLFDTDLDIEFIAHLGMTGQFVTGPDLDDPHLRAWWRLDDQLVLGFRDIRRFGRLRTVPRGDYSSIATLAALGPEPLSDDFTPDQLYGALRRSTRRVKTQLLSQRPVAGVGNIYADEALWRAGIAPQRRRVTRAQCVALHEAVRSVLAQGIDNGGTTLRDYRSTSGDVGANQHALLCYGRSGEPCARCGRPLARSVFDARTTTWCRSCQS